MIIILYYLCSNLDLLKIFLVFFHIFFLSLHLVVGYLLLFSVADGLLEYVGKSALAAVLAIVVRGHEDSRTTFLCRALASEPVDLPIVVNLVVLELCKMGRLVLVLDLLGGGVVLLLPLLGASP